MLEDTDYNKLKGEIKAANPADLLKLIESENEKIRGMVVMDGKLSEELLEALSKDKDVYVRCSLASRDDLPSKIQKILANDEDWGVRNSLANNNDVETDILKKLLNDGNPEVKASAREHLGYLSHN